MSWVGHCVLPRRRLFKFRISITIQHLFPPRKRFTFTEFVAVILLTVGIGFFSMGEVKGTGGAQFTRVAFAGTAEYFLFWFVDALGTHQAILKTNRESLKDFLLCNDIFSCVPLELGLTIRVGDDGNIGFKQLSFGAGLC